MREYIDRPIPRDDLLKCIEAARLAPSNNNSQPWKFIIIDDPLLKSKVCEKAFSGIYSMNRFVNRAPVLIVTISEKETFLQAIGKYIRGTNYYFIDIGIACEHLVLQATELGIGSCWIGWFNQKAVKQILKIPRAKKVVVLISLGYYEGDRSTEKSRKSSGEISSFNSYK